ncbi:MAG: invasion associated locus B family protein [Candidatus Competibacterales bacterium]|nr:invasion associated locus B family protein [Candidatus Competibacterales bacterium]
MSLFFHRPGARRGRSVSGTRHAGPRRRFRAALLGIALGWAATAPAQNPDQGQRFEDWTVGCEQLPGMDRERCFIYQTVVNNENEEPVLQMAIGYLPLEDGNEQPAGLLTLPLGVALPPGIRLRVDSNEPVRLQYERCVPTGCIAGFPLTEELIAQFRRGLKAEIQVHDGRRRVGLPISLKGFTAGFNSLR